MARLVIVEEIVNGFVVRVRGDAGSGAVAFAGDKALAKALEHARLYFLAPQENSGEASFPLAAVVETEVSALEPRRPAGEAAPTEATVRPVDPNATTIIRRPRWARPPMP